MPSRSKSMGFGFQPEESTHHFIVTVPAGNRQDVLIAEHLTFDPEKGPAPPSVGFGPHDSKLRALLPRTKWNALADDVRVEFNRRLKRQGLAAGRWKTGANPIARLLGKELTLLAWAVEDADPALIPAAVKNWLGLAPEERWWLFTMTNAATGHAFHGRGKGWRKAVRFALTENPVTGVRHDTSTEFFRLVGNREERAPRPRRRKSRTKRAGTTASGAEVSTDERTQVPVTETSEA